ncbi:ABC transporter permease [Acutalibacter intestini]|uniref:ABC transporter permease n=1 Tax=Acutalibacter intestini TaxID=3093659 RepID=UPI002AC8CFC5|nr:ABC transporter permease subunit [Acutalibacter sp. M00204]
MATATAKPQNEKSNGYWSRLFRDMLRDRWLYLLLLPGLIFFIIFKYIPMYDLRIAFMEYNAFDPSSSPWVGMKQFTDLFTKPQFPKVLGNTLYIAILKMVIGFPIPIILALMMNEMRNLRFKKVAQTLLYLPYFVSWVIMAGLVMNFLDPSNGIVTDLIEMISGQRIQVLTDKGAFVPMLIVSDIYKGMGWGTIIYFAALSGVDPQLYEAASIDGAKRFKQLLHVTIPAIMPTVIIMLIMNCNNILNAGFDQIFMLYSAPVYDVADIIDTYVYRIGVQKNSYSFSTAVGMFKSVIALLLIVTVNTVAKKTGNEGIW